MSGKKLTLEQQQEFIRALIQRCTLHSGEIATTTHLTLSAAEVEALGVVADTLNVFGIYGADRYVRDQAQRSKRR